MERNERRSCDVENFGQKEGIGHKNTSTSINCIARNAVSWIYASQNRLTFSLAVCGAACKCKAFVTCNTFSYYGL